MIKTYSEKPYEIEAILIDVVSIKEAISWLHATETAFIPGVSHIMYGAPTHQKVVNIGEYLVRGLGGYFDTMSVIEFERCYEVKIKTEKKVIKKK